MLKISKLGFDPANPPDGVWGTFTEGVELQVRKLTSEVITTLRRQFLTTSLELDQSSRRMMPIERLDSAKYNDALTDYLIQDFRGLGDDDGVALPLTLKSKHRILNYLPIRDWVWSFAQAVDSTPEQEKNS